jgi:hypothetical protein
MARTAHILFEHRRGPYVSDSTVAMPGPARTVVTPQYVTVFARLLGYAPRDMVALAGIDPVVEDMHAHHAAAELAKLAWNARGLSSGQITYVVKFARAAL